MECTINGIGERAGNASMEEIVMAIKTRKDIIPFYTDINTKEIITVIKIIIDYYRFCCSTKQGNSRS